MKLASIILAALLAAMPASARAASSLTTLGVGGIGPQTSSGSGPPPAVAHIHLTGRATPS
jgi:hypothetical protein